MYSLCGNVWVSFAMCIYNYLYISKIKYLFKIIKNNVCLFGKKLYLCTVVVWM